MPTPKLLDQVRTVIRVKHFSLSTEKAYVAWIRRFILFHGKRHPQYLGEEEIRQFISYLAVDAKISASTQTVALSALLFLYRQVLKKDLPYVANIERAKRSKRLPVVFTRNEVQAVLAGLDGTSHLIASLLYGSGLRLMEGVRLRVKDVDFERHELIIRQGKGAQDRVSMLPTSTTAPLKQQLQKVHLLHQADLKIGLGAVELPFALAKKYPAAAKQWGWQYVFPAAKRSRDPRSVLNEGITFSRIKCSARSRRRLFRHSSTGMEVVIHCVTASRLTSSKMVTISGRYKSYSGTKMFTP